MVSGYTERSNRLSGGSVPYFRVSTQIADEDDLIDFFYLGEQRDDGPKKPNYAGAKLPAPPGKW